jgi:hypothetical protein
MLYIASRSGHVTTIGPNKHDAHQPLNSPSFSSIFTLENAFDTHFNAVTHAKGKSSTTRAKIDATLLHAVITGKLAISKCESWLAFTLVGDDKGSQPTLGVLGRVAANVSHWNQHVGYIGFFEVAGTSSSSLSSSCLDHDTVGLALITLARQWLQRSLVSVIMGPVNISTFFYYRFRVDTWPNAMGCWEPNNPAEYVELFKKVNESSMLKIDGRMSF